MIRFGAWSEAAQYLAGYQANQLPPGHWAVTPRLADWAASESQWHQVEEIIQADPPNWVAITLLGQTPSFLLRRTKAIASHQHAELAEYDLDELRNNFHWLSLLRDRGWLEGITDAEVAQVIAAANSRLDSSAQGSTTENQEPN